MRRELLIPALLFLAAYACALAGLNPTFYLDDSPETVTAGATLGVPHPPGYPLHTMAARLFSLLPVSQHPFRVNLLSALLASAVVVLLFLFLRRVWETPAPLASALAFFWIAGNTTYPAALSAKSGIYHLTALLLLGILSCLMKRRFLLAAFLYGLALGNHWMSMAAYLPGFLLLGWGVSRAIPPERRDVAVMASLVVTGLSVYLYLPLRAALDPDLNWGNPVHWGDFTFNFLRTQYSQGESVLNAGVWMRQWVQYLRIAALEFPGLLLTALAGAFYCWRQDRPLARGLLLTWVGIVAAIGFYLNVKPERYYLIGAYALSSHLFLILFTAWAARRWAGSGGGRGREKFALVLALLLLLPTAGWRLVKQRQDRYTFAYDYLLNVWHGIPAGSLFFARGDGIVFPGWYFQWIEGRRPDLAVIGVDGLPMKWVRILLKRKHPELKIPFPEAQVPLVGNESIAPMTRFLYYANEDRAKYFSYNKIDDGSLPEVRLLPTGLVYRGVVPPAGVASPPIDEVFVGALWGRLRLRNLADRERGLDERTLGNLVKDYAVIRNSLGVYFEDMADEVKATAARENRPAPGKLLEHLYQQCYVHFTWARSWSPNDHEFTFNIGNSLFNLGRTAEATYWYEQSAKLKPDYADTYYNWGVAEYQMRNYQKAGELFDQVLRLDPNKKEADDALNYMLFNSMYRRK